MSWHYDFRPLKHLVRQGNNFVLALNVCFCSPLKHGWQSPQNISSGFTLTVADMHSRTVFTGLAALATLLFCLSTFNSFLEKNKHLITRDSSYSSHYLFTSSYSTNHCWQSTGCISSQLLLWVCMSDALRRSIKNDILFWSMLQNASHCSLKFKAGSATMYASLKTLSNSSSHTCGVTDSLSQGLFPLGAFQWCLLSGHNLTRNWMHRLTIAAWTRNIQSKPCF